MSITAWLTRRRPEPNTFKDCEQTSSSGMQRMRLYGNMVTSTISNLNEIDSLLSAKKIEFNSNFSSRATIPVKIGEYSALEIIFDKDGTKAICATLIK